MKQVFLLSLLLVMVACKPYPSDVRQVLKLSGDNRKELIGVLDHYKQTGENEKYRAAEFLIGNMANKYSRQLPNDSYYFSFLKEIDTLRNYYYEIVDPFIKAKWQKEQSNPSINLNYEYVYDYKVITARYLVNNIDLSFQVWKEKPWAHHLNFEQFCEWILPYRVYDEPLQDWRGNMYNTLSWLNDSLKNDADPKKACQLVDQYISKDYLVSIELGFIPLLGGNDLLKYKAGICEHKYLLTILAMRGMGIPVAVDKTPQLCKTKYGHSWSVLLDSDGNTKAFNGYEKPIRFRYPKNQPLMEGDYVIEEIGVTKVYRIQFRYNEQHVASLLPIEKVPKELLNAGVKDVTAEYDGVKQGTIKMDIGRKEKRNNKYAFLYVFDMADNYTAIAASKIEQGKVVFKNVGKNGLYFIGTYNQGTVTMIGNPFFFNSGSDSLQYIRPNMKERQHVKLYRKYYITFDMRPFGWWMKGAQLQGANRHDFSDLQVIHTIDTIFFHYKEFKVTPERAYRYYRYISPNAKDIRIADITLWHNDISGQRQAVKGKTFGFKSVPQSSDSAIFNNAFDNKIRTNFNAPAGSWVAIDAGKPVKLNEVRYLVRNDLNEVEPGDSYTLYYFDKVWNEIGTKKAADYFVEFDGVPKGALLWLNNNTKGREERVFIYENEEQEFW